MVRLKQMHIVPINRERRSSAYDTPRDTTGTWMAEGRAFISNIIAPSGQPTLFPFT